MSYIEVDELREHLAGSTLPDSALQRIIDDLEQLIDSRFGTLEAQTERIPTSDDWLGPIVLRRKPASIVSIVEDLDSVASQTRTLDPSDYRLNGYRLDRLHGGTYPARGWSTYGTTVVYIPHDDSATRAMAIVDAAKEEISHSGFASRRIGDYSEAKDQGGSVDEKRMAILRRRLAPKGGMVLR